MCRVFAIATLAIALIPNFAVAQRGERPEFRREEGDSRRDSTRRVNDDEEPLTPGFGEALTLPAVPGFGANSAELGGARNQGVSLSERYHPNVVAYVDQVIRRYDRSANGKLEREEWNSARWRSDPASSDLNKDGILTREELCERVKTYDEFRGLSGSGSGSVVSGATSSTATDKAKLEEYAKGLMKRYDDNDNGVLESSEFQEMSSFHRGADGNGDGIITRDELAIRLANYGSSSGASSSSDNSDDRGERKSSERSGNISQGSKGYRTAGREAYRMRTTTERLPKGLPDWFVRNDADGDGQISMAEFAVSWTDDKLEEFMDHDLNGDGLITPQECLHERPAKSSAAPAERSRFGRSRGR